MCLWVGEKESVYWTDGGLDGTAEGHGSAYLAPTLAEREEDFRGNSRSPAHFGEESRRRTRSFKRSRDYKEEEPQSLKGKTGAVNGNESPHSKCALEDQAKVGKTGPLHRSTRRSQQRGTNRGQPLGNGRRTC